MSETIKNVAILGASGSLGAPILEALAKSGKFNVFVLTRESSTHTFPYGEVVPVKVDDVESLTTVFRQKKIDAVVSCAGTEGLLGQTIVIDAAAAAGVKRFLPSEFGCDLDNPQTRALPVFGYKVAVQKHVEEKAAANPGFTYTLVRCGPFLDWGISVGFLIDLKNGTPQIYDSGDQLFSATTLTSVGLAVVGVLTHPQETANRAVYVEDAQVSQNQLLKIAKTIAPGKEWKPVPTDVAKIKEGADAQLAKQDFSALYLYILVAIYGDGYGAVFSKTDNELLGVPGKTEKDLEDIIKPLLA